MYVFIFITAISLRKSRERQSAYEDDETSVCGQSITNAFAARREAKTRCLWYIGERPLRQMSVVKTVSSYLQASMYRVLRKILLMVACS